MDEVFLFFLRAVQCVFSDSSMLFHPSTSNAEFLWDVRRDPSSACRPGPNYLMPIAVRKETLKRPLHMAASHDVVILLRLAEMPCHGPF